MAETTTYKAIVEVETKGTDKVEELGKTTEETAEGFTRLQLRIRETQKELQKAAAAGDKLKFSQLKGELEELEDELEAVQLAAGKFDDTLASLPGPAGAAGNAIKSVDGAFKLLAANPVVAVIAALGGIFLLLFESLNKTAKGQEVLNRLSEAFGKILGPIMALVQKVAIPVFEGFAFILEKVGEGFSKFAKFLGIAEADIEEASRNSSEALKKQYEDQQKLEEEADKKAEEARKKREEDRKKAAEERKKREEEAQKILTEATLSLLGDRDREIKEREIRFQEELKKLKAAGVKDLTNFEAEYRLDVLNINKKFDDEEKKRVEEKQKEDEAKRKEQAEKDKAERDRLFQDRLLGIESNLEFEAQTADDKLRLITEKEQALLAQEGLTQNERTLIARQAAREREDVAIAEQDAKAEILMAELALVGQFGSFLSQIAGENKKLAIAGVLVQQAASIGQIIASTAIANAKAVAASPLTGGLPWTAINSVSAGLSIASSIAAAVKSIQQIKAAGSGSGTPQSASVPRLSAGISAAGVEGTSSPVIGGTQQVNTGTQIAQTIGRGQQAPVRAYVVSGDISSQQALDRRTSVAATFG